MKTLKLAKDLSLPVDVVTQTVAILAKRRAGKSYTMRRLVEQLHQANQQIVLVDPKGDQWGIRSAADGKSPGLPVVILGGERADVPLEASNGEIVAKLVVEERVSVLLDLSLFRKHEVSTFMTGFLENVYRLKAREIYRTPMMLVIDEADAIAPQKPQKGEERMLGAAEDIVRRGGQRGIGCVLVTQRSAVLNKNVLTQAQVLVALRTIAPQDLDALNAWIDVHGTPEQRKTLMESLPSLPVGDAWFWSPGWPTVDGIFKRVHVLSIETFDSGATPKPGEKRLEPKHLADVDLEALKRQMSATIEKAKADDPRELRKQIAELKKALAAKPSVAPQKESSPKVVEKFILKDGQLARLEKVYQRMFDEADRHREAMSLLWQQQSEEAKALLAVLQVIVEGPATVAQHRPKPVLVASPPRPPAPRPVARAVAADSNGLPSGERKILTALGQHPDGCDRTQLSILSGFKRSTRDRYIQFLQQKGFARVEGDTVLVTSDGLSALGDFEPLPTGAALFTHWVNTLPQGEAVILSAVAEGYPDPVNREKVSEATGFKRSTRDRYIQFLQARKLVTADRDGVRASDELFD